MIVFVHGFLGGAATWADVRALVAQPSQIIELPGHGLAPWYPRADRFGDAVDALAARLPERAHLVGYSLGARVALAIALRHPRRVTGALLVGVDPGLDDERARAARVAEDDARAGAILTRGLPAFVDAWQELPLFATQRALPAATRARIRAERLAHTPDGIAWSLRVLGLGRMPNMWRALADCAVPLRVLAGARDDKFSTIAHAIAAAAPSACVRIVPDVGHNVAIEAPRTIAEELERP